MGSPFTLAFPNPKLYVPEFTGSYSLSAITGLTTGIAAGGTLFSFCWDDNTNTPPLNAVIKSLRVGVETTTAFTTAQDVSVSLFVARAFTAADTGGTTISLAGNNQKHRTNMAASAVNDMRVATTATLTPGTRTLDALPIATFVGFSSGAGITQLADARWSSQGHDAQQYPLVLFEDEGIVITNVTAQGAAGVVKYFFDLSWAEGMF
jgi:hypothetical protein